MVTGSYRLELPTIYVQLNKVVERYVVREVENRARVDGLGYNISIYGIECPS